MLGSHVLICGSYDAAQDTRDIKAVCSCSILPACMSHNAYHDLAIYFSAQDLDPKLCGAPPPDIYRAFDGIH
jgi:hypothetical protein